MAGRKLARRQESPALLAPVAQPSALHLLAAATATLCDVTAMAPLLVALQCRRPLLEHSATVRTALQAAGEARAAAHVWATAQRAIGIIETRRRGEQAELKKRLKALEEAG